MIRGLEERRKKVESMPLFSEVDLDSVCLDFENVDYSECSVRSLA